MIHMNEQQSIEQYESQAIAEQQREEEFLAREFEVLPEIEAYENSRWLYRLWELKEGK